LKTSTDTECHERSVGKRAVEEVGEGGEGAEVEIEEEVEEGGTQRVGQ